MLLGMAETPELLSLATSAATEAGIPVDLFLGLVKTESDWNPSAQSGAGALGLTQVMPIWASPSYAASIGMAGISPSDLLNPEISLKVGARILASELKRFGIPQLALMAYNAGSGVVRDAINRAGSTDPAAVSAQLPAAETRSYWQKVENWAAVYAQKMSALGAATENVITDVSESTRGTAAPLLLFFLALGGIILWVRR